MRGPLGAGRTSRGLSGGDCCRRVPVESVCATLKSRAPGTSDALRVIEADIIVAPKLNCTLAAIRDGELGSNAFSQNQHLEAELTCPSHARTGQAHDTQEPSHATQSSQSPQRPSCADMCLAADTLSGRHMGTRPV